MSRFPLPHQRLLAVATTAVLACTPLWAGTIDLAWDPVAGATGYRVYFGDAPGNYAQSQTFSGTQGSLTNLADCRPYYVAVKAYNAAGESQEFSNEVSGWPRPVVSAASPAAALQGDQPTVILTGNNFQAGATVEIDNPHVTITNVVARSCSQIELLMDIETRGRGVQASPVGRFRMTVANPDDVFGDQPDVFEVRVNPPRFDVNQDVDSTRGRIDGLDTISIARWFGGQEGTPLYQPDADINGDGWVDGQDLDYVAANFGRCWSPSNWTIAACEGR